MVMALDLCGCGRLFVHGRTVVTVSSSSSFWGGCWVGYTFHGAVIVHVFRVYSWGGVPFFIFLAPLLFTPFLFFFFF